ncbi:MAG: hypothetical protein ACRYFR_03865 [Janthinobacterium lividum]
MKNTLLALALFAAGTTAFAHEGPGKPAAKKDNCTGATAAQCTKGMTAGGNMAGMPACCRAKMAAAKAAGAPATAKPLAKTM